MEENNDGRAGFEESIALFPFVTCCFIEDSHNSGIMLVGFKQYA